MGFLENYKETYKELTGKELRWRTGFGFAYQMHTSRTGQIRDTLGKDDLFKYKDPEKYVECIRMRCRHLHDPTLRMLIDEYIGDFGELIEFEEEPSENEYGLDRKKYHDLMHFDHYLLDSIAREGYIIGQIAKRNAEPRALVDRDWEEEEEEERPEGSWDELWQEIYRCRKEEEEEEEEEEREGLPSTFGELFWKMHWY